MSDSRRELILASVQQLRVQPDQVIELRALGVPRRYGKPATVSGYFDDLDQLAEAAVELENRNAFGLYVTLNVVNPALLARACNRLEENPKATTTDKEIVRRVYLPFDFDALRPAGISASTSEILAARDRALLAERWISETLQDTPTIWGFSGNGFHLLYRVDLPNTAESTETVKRDRADRGTVQR